MSTITVGMLLCVSAGKVPAQAQPVDVSSRVSAVSLDSLLVYVSELSGEAPIYVADSTLIVEWDSTGAIDSVWVFDAFVRLPNREGGANDAAAAYLQQKLMSFGYDSVIAETYPGDRGQGTTNVLAFKPGVDPNGPVWLIGAHYDSVIMAPGADDNASGTAVVLECARVLAHTELTASVVFGFWDREEAGLIGSDLFAEQAFDRGLRIDGVLNIDMVGWDGDGDRAVEIHADSNAFWLGGYVRDVTEDHDLNLNPRLRVPGIGRSDHVSFRVWGYPAILIIEEFGDDFNPYYHSPQDVVEHFSTGFFHEVTKLAVATVTQLALSGTTVSTERDADAPSSMGFESIYPNPGARDVQFSFAADRKPGRLVVTDILGRRVAAFALDARTSLRWIIPSDLPNGTYFATLIREAGVYTRPFVVLR